MVARMRVYPYNFYPSSSYMKISIVASKKKKKQNHHKNFDEINISKARSLKIDWPSSPGSYALTL